MSWFGLPGEFSSSWLALCLSHTASSHSTTARRAGKHLQGPVCAPLHNTVHFALCDMPPCGYLLTCCKFTVHAMEVIYMPCLNITLLSTLRPFALILTPPPPLLVSLWTSQTPSDCCASMLWRCLFDRERRCRCLALCMCCSTRMAGNSGGPGTQADQPDPLGRMSELFAQVLVLLAV